MKLNCIWNLDFDFKERKREKWYLYINFWISLKGKSILISIKLNCIWNLDFEFKERSDM